MDTSPGGLARPSPDVEAVGIDSLRPPRRPAPTPDLRRANPGSDVRSCSRDFWGGWMTRRWRAVLVTVALVVAASTATSTTSAASAWARPASSQLDRNVFVHGPGQTTPPPLAAGLSSATALSCPGGDSWEYAARSETIGVVVEVYCSDSRWKGGPTPGPWGPLPGLL